VALGMGLGAFGAHLLEAKVTSDQLEVWRTANQYHLLNAIGLLVVCALAKAYKLNSVKSILVLLVLGIIFFSGSLYLLAVSDLLPMTPIGGLMLISAWLILGFKFFRKNGHLE